MPALVVGVLPSLAEGVVHILVVDVNVIPGSVVYCMYVNVALVLRGYTVLYKRMHSAGLLWDLEGMSRILVSGFNKLALPVR
jgi:hypothetical protein